ncbi:hypothetical protein, partial [Acinetobacter colistiniresistens]
MKENLTVSLCLCIGLLSGCTNSSNVKQDLKSGGIGAAGMLLTDSEVYRKATAKDLDAITLALLFSTLDKMAVLKSYEEESKGAYLLEDTFTVGNANQFCWINNFLIKHRKELPRNLDDVDT